MPFLDDATRAGLGSRAKRSDAARSRLTSAGLPFGTSSSVGGAHSAWGKRVGAVPDVAPRGRSEDRPSTAALGRVLDENPFHAETLLRPAMTQRLRSVKTPFDAPVGFRSSTQKTSMESRRSYATRPRTKGKTMEEEAAQLSGWIDSLKGNLPSVDGEGGGRASPSSQRRHRGVAGGHTDNFGASPWLALPPRPETAARSIANVLAKHDELFGTRRPGTAASAGYQRLKIDTTMGHGDFDDLPGFSPSSRPVSGYSSRPISSRQGTSTALSSPYRTPRVTAGYELEAEATERKALRSKQVMEMWVSFTLKLTARRDHAIKLGIDEAERRATRRPLGGLRESLEQTVQLARVAALYEDTYARASVAAAGGIDVLVAGEGSKLSDAVGVSTRAAHEAAERSRARNRRGATSKVDPDGTVRLFNKDGKPLAQAADEGRSRERLDIISRAMIRREAYSLVPRARRDWLVEKGMLARGGVEPRDRLNEESQRLATAHELREQRAIAARKEANDARKNSWSYVLEMNRRKKEARQARKERLLGAAGGVEPKTPRTPSKQAAKMKGHSVFHGSLAGNQVVHDLIVFAMETVGANQPERGWDPSSACREANERMTLSKDGVAGAIRAEALAAPDEVILGVPGTTAVVEEARALRAAALLAAGGATRGEESFASKITSESDSDDDSIGVLFSELSPGERGPRASVGSVGRPHRTPQAVDPATEAEVAAEFAHFLRTGEEDVRDAFHAVMGGDVNGGAEEPRPGTSGSGASVPAHRPFGTGGDSSVWRRIGSARGTRTDESRVGSARGGQDIDWSATHRASAEGRDGSLHHRTPTPGGHLAGVTRDGPLIGAPHEPQVWVNDGGGEEGVGEEEEEVDPVVYAAAEATAKAAAAERARSRWRAACGQVLLARWRHRNLVRHAGTATPSDRMFFKHFSRRLSRMTTTLDLTATAFGLRHAALLGPFLQVHIGVVRNLSLANNPLVPRATAIAVAAVQLAAGTVMRLDLSNCGLSPTHVPRLQSLLLPSAGPAALGLTELVLSNNNLGDTGFSALAACLCGEYGGGVAALRRLEVSNCSLGVVAADAIGGILRNNTNLEELDVSCNIFGATGAAHIAGGVASNDSLAVMDLTGCQLGGSGVAVLAVALLPRCGEDSNAFETTDAQRVISAVAGGAGSNRVKPGSWVDTVGSIKAGLKLFKDLGAVAKLNQAPGNISVREMWLGDNNADRRCVFALIAAMAAHPQLTVLELRSNPLGPAVARRLLRAFRAAPWIARLGLAGVDLRVKNIHPKSGGHGTDLMCGWDHYDEANPAPLTYQMRLSDPFGRQMATEMSREWWNRDGGRGDEKQVWRQCFMDRSEGGVAAGTVMGKEGTRNLAGVVAGEPFTLKTFNDWPARLPDRADLTVTLAPRRVEDYPTPEERATHGVMSSEQFDAVWDGVIVDATQLGAVGATASSATDAWRLDYAKVLGDAVWFTPDQVARVVASFDWPADRVDILARLIPRLVDTGDFLGVQSLETAVGLQTWMGAMNALGFHRLVCVENPSGAYNLNLAAPLDRLVVSWLRSHAITSSKLYPGRCGWRNIRLDGVWVKAQGISRSLGTTTWEALTLWNLPPRGVLSLDHVGEPLPPLSTWRGTLPSAALHHLQVVLRSSPPYAAPSLILKAAADAAVDAARDKAARAAERAERRRVAEIEASKARVQGKAVSAEVQAVLDEVDQSDGESEEEDEGAYWDEARDDEETGELVRNKWRRAMMLASMEAQGKKPEGGDGAEQAAAEQIAGSHRKPSKVEELVRKLSLDNTTDEADADGSLFRPSPRASVKGSRPSVKGSRTSGASLSSAAEGDRSGVKKNPLTEEEKAIAKLELLRAIADAHRPTAHQVVVLLKASKLLEADVPVPIPNQESSTAFSSRGRKVELVLPSKWPGPDSTGIRSGMSHMALSTDASWGPSEPQTWHQSQGFDSFTTAAMAVVGFYGRLAYPQHADPGSTFFKIMEHVPRKVQLEIHERLGSSAVVPSNFVTNERGLSFKLRMSDHNDASIAKRLARLRCKAGDAASMKNITVDGKKVRDISDSDPNLWTRIWRRAEGRAEVEFHIECTELGLARARVATVQSLWRRHVARRVAARQRWRITVLAPRFAKRWLARARATLADRREYLARKERETKRRAVQDVSKAFGDGALEQLTDKTVLEAALAETDDAALVLERRAQRNWALGTRLGRRRRLDEQAQSSSSSDNDDD